MKSFYLLFIFVLMISTGALAQDDEPDNRPVRAPYESGVLIDNQSTLIQPERTLEFVINHRFGTIKNGITDVWGIYAPSNIRLGLNYSLTDEVMLGWGYTKDRKLMDFRGKWNIFHQTRSGSMPVAVTFYGNMGIDCRNSEYFGLNYEFTNRFSFFSQLIISRKFNYWLTLQFAPSFSHINTVPDQHEHDKVGISFAGRARISPQSSIIFNYDQPLEFKEMYEWKDPLNKPKPNLAIGWEISTSTHAFQIFLGTANTLSPQYNMMTNQNDWTDGEMMFGFNITRLWSF